MRERMVRGELWAIVHNTVTGEHIRINATLLDVVRRIDGHSSLQSLLTPDEIEKGKGVAGDASLEAIAAGLLTLSQCGMLTLGLPGDAERLLHQHRRFVRKYAPKSMAESSRGTNAIVQSRQLVRSIESMVCLRVQQDCAGWHISIVFHSALVCSAAGI